MNFFLHFFMLSTIICGCMFSACNLDIEYQNTETLAQYAYEAMLCHCTNLSVHANYCALSDYVTKLHLVVIKHDSLNFMHQM